MILIPQELNASVTSDEVTVAVTGDATTTITQGATLSVVKDVDQPTISSPVTLTYTITVSNTGNISLNNVVVVDDLAGSATLTSGDTDTDGVLDVGETWIYGATYDASQSDIDAGVDLVNTASVTSDEVTTAVTDDATTTISQTASPV